jgi:hypothetical protein
MSDARGEERPLSSSLAAFGKMSADFLGDTLDDRVGLFFALRVERTGEFEPEVSTLVLQRDAEIRAGCQLVIVEVF